jgi:hypothetical protein
LARVRQKLYKGEVSMKLLKRDFVSKGVISVKNYPLRSGKAYFIESDNGELLYASIEYVKDNFIESERKGIIDLTKGLTSTFKNDGGGNSSGGGYVSIDEGLQKQKFAISYLVLTQEKLQNFTGYKDKLNDFLLSLYDFYKEKSFLSTKQIEKILEIELQQREEKNSRNCKVLSFKNLQTCYAYEYKIKRAIEELSEDKQQYMLSMLDNLHRYLYLTKSQVDGMMRWFEYLPADLKDTRLEKFDV